MSRRVAALRELARRQRASAPLEAVRCLRAALDVDEFVPPIVRGTIFIELARLYLDLAADADLCRAALDKAGVLLPPDAAAARARLALLYDALHLRAPHVVGRARARAGLAAAAAELGRHAAQRLACLDAADGDFPAALARLDPDDPLAAHLLLRAHRVDDARAVLARLPASRYSCALAAAVSLFDGDVPAAQDAARRAADLPGEYPLQPLFAALLPFQVGSGVPGPYPGDCRLATMCRALVNVALLLDDGDALRAHEDLSGPLFEVRPGRVLENTIVLLNVHALLLLGNVPEARSRLRSLQNPLSNILVSYLSELQDGKSFLYSEEKGKC